jgi:uncharacterized DUF497 family protein
LRIDQGAAVYSGLVYTYTVCIIGAVKITYDPGKREINLKRHKVDLADVEGVFTDAFALTQEDRDHDEERFVTLGMDGFGRLLVVAYTYRGRDEIRVISARFAEPHERRYYEEG